ncbi:MAG: HAD family phosphatase [Zestosphaera sp.]
MIRGVVFDLDGTLVDTVDLHVLTWVEACRELGVEVSEAYVRGLVGLSAEDIAKSLVSDFNKALRLAKLKRKIYLARVNEVKLFPEVPEVLEELKYVYGLRLAVASSTNLETIVAVLKAKNIMDFFDSFVGSDIVSRGKPEPDMFIEALNRIDVRPHESFIVGDTEYDIIPANLIGAISVLICRSECRSSTVKPRHIIKDLRELIDLVKEHK